MFFFSKKVKNCFYYLLVSDPIVTLTCLSVRDDLFAFPIDFFWGLSPSLYADQVLCAAFRAALPPIFYSGGAKIENGETLHKCTKRLFYATGPQKLSSRSNESSIFFARKKSEKICQRKLPKLSSRSNQSSNFAIVGGSKMSLQEHSERQHDFNIFPKTRQNFDKKSQKFKDSMFSLELALTCR